jgi:hypothetical protein
MIVQPVRPHSAALKDGYEVLAVEENSTSAAHASDQGILRSSFESPTRSRVSSVELTRSRSPLHRPHVHYNPTDEAMPSPAIRPSHTRSHSLSPDVIDIYGGALWSTTDFWILCAALTCLSGVGLMYINNAGTVALALARKGSVEYDVKEVAKWQSTQVAVVSLWNCGGRVLMGGLSDIAKAHYGIRRVGSDHVVIRADDCRSGSCSLSAPCLSCRS